MPTKSRQGETYQLITTEELEKLGFFRKEWDPYSWYLYPSRSEVFTRTTDMSTFKTKQIKSFDNMHHLHVITIDLGDGDLGLREIKIKSKSDKGGWWLKRKQDTGLFRLSANRDKTNDYFRDDSSFDGKRHFFLTDDPAFNYSRVITLVAMIPKEWMHPDKPVTASAQALLKG